jgi:hypothetical protein
VAFDLSGLASATPWGAAASAIGGALSSTPSSSLTAGPVTTGPKVINVAGFGSKSSGSATQSLTQAEPDRGEYFPSTPSGSLAGVDVPPWVLPAVGVVLALGLVGAFVARRK